MYSKSERAEQLAENEKLDLAYHRSGRWQKWRESIRSGKSVAEVADEGVRCLVKTFNRLQKLFESVPLKQVLMAATGEDGTFDEIMRQARLGRDYLQLFESQCGQGLDERTIVENVMTLTIDRVMDQIRHELVGGEQFPNARSFREFGLSIKDQMIDGVLDLERKLVGPAQMSTEAVAQDDEANRQVKLLTMSILPEWLRDRLGRRRGPMW